MKKMYKIIIIVSVALCLTIMGDFFSRYNFQNKEWKHYMGPRICDFIDLSEPTYHHFSNHKIKRENDTKGILIASIGKWALIYVTDGKDCEKGMSVYIKLG